MKAAHLLSNLGLLGFALASVVFLVAQQVGERGAPESGRREGPYAAVALGLFVAASLAVTGALAAGFREVGFADVTSLLLAGSIGWLAILAHTVFKMRLIGAFVAPLSTLILLIRWFVAPARMTAVPEAKTNVLLAMHVIPAVLGQAFAIIACAVSVVFLWQQSLLKKKLLDQIPKNIPAIDKLERILMLSLWCGFLFITIGLLSGALYAQLNAPALGFALQLKAIWATGVWLWYLVTLLARNAFNWPSKRVAQMSLGGFVLLAITYFGMGFFTAVADVATGGALGP